MRNTLDPIVFLMGDGQRLKYEAIGRIAGSGR